MFCDADTKCMGFAYQDSQKQCILLGAGAPGDVIMLVGGSTADYFAAVRVANLASTVASTVLVTPVPSPSMSGLSSGGSVTAMVTASETVKSGCVRRTAVIAVTA